MKWRVGISIFAKIRRAIGKKTDNGNKSVEAKHLCNNESAVNVCS